MSKNELRTARTKGRLVQVARELFARDGYAQTGTETIIAAAGVKRGALYHHFRDKADLFEAVCRDLAGEAAEAVTVATEVLTDPVEMLEKGAVAWIDYMGQPENRRILVVDAPSVLGRKRWEMLDRDLSFDLLRTGVAQAVEADAIRFSAGADVLAILLNGLMNEIALRADEDATALKNGFLELLRSLKA